LYNRPATNPLFILIEIELRSLKLSAIKKLFMNFYAITLIKSISSSL
jgi:hypothetical protein